MEDSGSGHDGDPSACDLIESGDLVARDDQLRLYRRALYGAVVTISTEQLGGRPPGFVAPREWPRTSGTLPDRASSGSSEFWDKDDSFAHEKNALRSAGFLFVLDDRVVIPEEIAPGDLADIGHRHADGQRPQTVRVPEQQ